MRVLVTGGTGYIGSHTVIELMQAGHDVFIVDNLSNSSTAVLDSIARITGQKPGFMQADIQDQAQLLTIAKDKRIEAVVHFAAYKFVGEAVTDPLKYYSNNVGGMVSLLKTILATEIRKFVFSSSAAVYGNPPDPEATEETPCNPENPYGWSKFMDEVVLRDTCKATPELRGIALRYFNVVGAHESGLIGESGKQPPQNLLPVIIQSIVTNKPLDVFGTDYPTPDGTCLRDYIHVVDLAKAHVAALDHITAGSHSNYGVYNIGTGQPTSVMELIKAFERVNKIKVPYTLSGRRAGDPVAYYANSHKAEQELHWRAAKTVEDAVADAWRWQQNHATD